MTIETKNGDFLGLFEEIRIKGRGPHNRVTLSKVPTDKIEAELKRRREVVPFVEFADMIILRAKNNGIELLPERLVYELHYDILRRPEMFIGYNLSNMTLEKVLEENEKIRKGLLPSLTEDERRVAWTERLHIRHDTGKASVYHTDGSSKSINYYVDIFLSQIKGAVI